MGKFATIGLALVVGVTAGAIVASRVTLDEPTVEPPGPPTTGDTSGLYVQPEGLGPDACGDYIATWLDLLHAEDAFPIDELKADLGQGPLRVAIDNAWTRALDMETRMPRQQAARSIVPTIVAACEDPYVRVQFLQVAALG